MGSYDACIKTVPIPAAAAYPGGCSKAMKDMHAAALGFFRVAFGGLMVAHAAHIAHVLVNSHPERMLVLGTFDYSSRIPNSVAQWANEYPWVQPASAEAWVLYGATLVASAAFMALGWGYGSRLGALAFATFNLVHVLQNISDYNNHEWLYTVLAALIAVSGGHEPQHSLLARAAIAAFHSQPAPRGEAPLAKPENHEPLANQTDCAGTALWLFGAGCTWLCTSQIFITRSSKIPVIGVLMLWVASAIAAQTGCNTASESSGATAHAGGRVGTAVLWLRVRLLKLCITAVYGYAAVAKVSNDWTSGSIVRLLPRLRGQFSPDWVHELLPCVPWLMVWPGLFADVLLTVGAWVVSPLVCTVTVVTAIVFHASNHWLFMVGTFPWVMISALIFVHGVLPGVLLAITAVLSSKPATALLIGMGIVRRAVGMVVSYFVVGVIFAAVLLVPMPCALDAIRSAGDPYAGGPDSIGWGSQCNFFSWRMMTRLHKEGPITRLHVHDPIANISAQIPLNEFATRGCRSGCYKAVMMEDVAWKIARFTHADIKLTSAAGPRLQVRLDGFIEINGPPMQRYIDPRVDLAQQPRPCAFYLSHSRNTNGQGVCELPSPSKLMYMFVTALTSGVPYLAPWVLPRLQQYHTSVWHKRFEAIRLRAAETGMKAEFMAGPVLTDDTGLASAAESFYKMSVSASTSMASVAVLHGAVEIRGKKTTRILKAHQAALYLHVGAEFTIAPTHDSESGSALWYFAAANLKLLDAGNASWKSEDAIVGVVPTSEVPYAQVGHDNVKEVRNEF